MAKCDTEKKICSLFIWLAQFFRLSYSNFMAKGVGFMGTKVQIFRFHLLSEIWGGLQIECDFVSLMSATTIEVVTSKLLRSLNG